MDILKSLNVVVFIGRMTLKKVFGKSSNKNKRNNNTKNRNNNTKKHLYFIKQYYDHIFNVEFLQI